jgi:hypothetical protein
MGALFDRPARGGDMNDLGGHKGGRKDMSPSLPIYGVNDTVLNDLGTHKGRGKDMPAQPICGVRNDTLNDLGAHKGGRKDMRCPYRYVVCTTTH